MFRLIAALSVALFLMPVAAEAKTFRLGKPAVATVSIPDSWKPEETEDGIEANSPDGTIYLSIEVAPLGDGTALAKAMRAAVDWVTEQGAKLNGYGEAVNATVNGWEAIAATTSGKDADGNDTMVDVVGVIVSPTTGLVLLSWYDPRGEKNRPAVERIINSLKPAR
jgi:hypothetical protein